MDTAVYDSADQLIIGARGNRVFKCNPTTGAIITSADLGTVAFGKAALAWDAGSNTCFLAAWNAASFGTSGGVLVSDRNIYRFTPSTLLEVSHRDIVTLLGLSTANFPLLESGIGALDASGGKVYARYWQSHSPPNAGGVSGGSARFNADFTVVQNDNSGLTGGYPNLVHGVSGGHDLSIYPDQSTPQVIIYDWFTATEIPFNVPLPAVMLAVGYAPTSGLPTSPSQNTVIVTDVAQKIYGYSTVGALLWTIDTARSAFNGVAVRYNATTGLVYVPGGCDNTVVVINPATGSISGLIRTGFDCPVDVVATASKTFAVQQGGTPLKEIS